MPKDVLRVRSRATSFPKRELNLSTVYFLFLFSYTLLTVCVSSVSLRRLLLISALSYSKLLYIL